MTQERMLAVQRAVSFLRDDGLVDEARAVEWLLDHDSPGRWRRWGVLAFRQLRGAPMVSLGIHMDLHTPRVDLHLPFWTVCIGRIVWQPGRSRWFVIDDRERWGGHSDDCWHREVDR